MVFPVKDLEQSTGLRMCDESPMPGIEFSMVLSIVGLRPGVTLNARRYV